MDIKKITTLEEFQNLQVGDTIIVRFGECGRGMKEIMVFNIPMVQHQYDEIICDMKKNIYFNYKMHLGIDRPGICTSNAKDVFKVLI